MSNDSLKNIHWLGHASFRIDGRKTTVYLDPWQLSEDPKPADLILITHDHRDHCSPEDVAKIQKDDTVIVTVKESAEKLEGMKEIVQPGDQIFVRDVEIKAVPAYNLTKYRSPGVLFHPKEKAYIGFIITIDGQKIYHAGDTDIIPEMSDIDADVAMLPVSGTYVMTADEALEAARIINPKVVIPMHVGRGIGSAKDAEDFKSRSTIPVEILTVDE